MEQDMSKFDTCMDDDGRVWTELPDGQKVMLLDTVGERRLVSDKMWDDMDPSYSEMPDPYKELIVSTVLFAIFSILLLAFSAACA